MSVPAQAVAFDCEGARLAGVLHPGAPGASTGVLVVVGGPQYRVGSHRQFVLLGRALAARGVPALRFDYRGLGDSQGEFRGFEGIDADVHAALDEFFRRSPGLRRVVIWGLCDAASAALFYAAGDARVAGLVLLNPWVRSQQTIARAYLRSYYLRRIFDPRAWRELLFGGKSLRAVVASFARLVGDARGGEAPAAAGRTTTGQTTTAQATGDSALPGNSVLVQRMQRGLAAFKGPVLLVLSGDDITAAEFRTATTSTAWRRLLEDRRVTSCPLDVADHTFSSRAWRDQVAAWTGDWVLGNWPARDTAGARDAAARETS